MQTNQTTRLSEILIKNEREILAEWTKSLQQAPSSHKSEFNTESSLKQVCSEFLSLFMRACDGNDFEELKNANWQKVRDMLADFSSTRAIEGFSPTETALFVFSLKQPLFDRLRKEIKDSQELLDQIWLVTKTIDQLGLYTSEVHQRSREEVIRRQQHEMLELSTPVIRLWDKILAVPLIGTLDSARTQTIMESLLTQIVETGSKVAILDITGVPTVDTETAQHLIKTVSAARLMGAECIISGIRPQIAQTIVHLGIDIFDIRTKANMADAIQEAMAQVGWTVKHTSDH